MELEEKEDMMDMANPGAANETAVGLADVMAKILRSTKPKKRKGKSIILSRAKKDLRVENQNENNDQQVIGTDDELERPFKQSRRTEAELENLNRRKPSPVDDLQLERQLIRIATKGVVQLFNAVSTRSTSNGQPGRS